MYVFERHALCALVLSLVWACCPTAGAQPPFAARLKSAHASVAASSGSDAVQGGRPSASATSPVRLPSGRLIASLPARECQRLLRGSRVSFESVPSDAAPHVHEPVYLLSALRGVSFAPTNGLSEHGMVDCRLAVALLAWAPLLEREGVVRVEHYSTYRPGARVRGNGRSSGHARALAIDAARFHLRDGRVLDVDEDWNDRSRGAEPCSGRHRETEASSLLRRVVCGAVERDIFQVVITPHHDRAHQNHVHLELVPDVDWSFIH